MLPALLLVLAVGPPPPIQDQPAALSILPAGGGQSRVVPDLCNVLAGNGDLTGSYFCLRPDGGSISGQADGGTAMALSAVGSPTTQTLTVCPSGPNCDSLQAQRLDGTNTRFKTGNGDFAQGDFSAGCVVRFDDATATQVFLDHDNAGNEVFTMYLSSSSAFAATRDGTAQTISNATPTTLVSRAPHLVGVAFDYVGAGAQNTATMYLDGAPGTAKTTMRPPLAAAGSPTTIAVRATTTLPAPGAYRNCFMTDKLLTTAQWSQLASASLGGLSASYGETLTFVRASAATCMSEDGQSVTGLPYNRPCVVRGALRVEPSATNLLLRGQTLANASWAKSNMDCTSATTGLDSSPTASTCTATADNGTVLQALTLAAATRVASLDVKRRTGTGAISITRDNGSTWTALDATNCRQGDVLTAPNATSWVRCWLSSSVENPTIGLKLATNTDAIDVDYFGDEVGSFPTSRIRTNGTSAVRGSAYATAAVPASMSLTEGCASFCFTPSFTGNPATMRFLEANGSTTALLAYVNSPDNNFMTYDGTHQPTVAVTYSANVRVCGLVSWSATRNNLHLENLTTGAVGTATAFTAFPSFTTLASGASPTGVNPAFGWLGDIKFDNNPDGCR